MTPDASVPFPYMRWAKEHLTGFAPMNLGMSGLPLRTPQELPVPAFPYWAPEGAYGDPALRKAVAEHVGVPDDHVFVSAGASLANFLVYLAEARGAHVAVETPAYEALLRLPDAVGAKVSPFARVEDRDWAIDPDALRSAVRAGTRLLVVTDLHNPSGKRLSEGDLALLDETARRVGAAVLVDEVYLELALAPAKTAALRNDRFLSTNSLTKAHGLGGLRVGWILAAPERIRRIAEWNDLVCPAHPVPSLEVAKAWFPRAAAHLRATHETIRDRLGRVDAWVRGRSDVSWRKPDGGISGFLRLPSGMDGDRLAVHAEAVYGVRVVPGSFFQSKGHVRISFGLPAADLERALLALGRAIDDLDPGRAR